MWLLLAFIAVPLIEIALFIQVGGAIGLWPTLAIVVATALLGTFLVRQQGALALQNIKRTFNQLEDPSEALAHGAMILFSGALLLTPGFFTDALGFALLVPRFRTFAFQWIRTRITIGTMHTPPHGPERGASRDDAIDAEYEVINFKDNEVKGPSGWTKD